MKRILFSNLGYAKGIDGSLRQHAGHFGRHLYCPVPVQQQVLSQVRALIDAQSPDICCFVEIDNGSIHSGGLRQIEALMDDEHYRFHDIAGKYGNESFLRDLPFHTGKSNAFLARADVRFERHYFTHGSKRLIYNLRLPDGLRVFFTHFSLRQAIRQRQFIEMRDLIGRADGPVVIMADFNILRGVEELRPLLEEGGLVLMNQEEDYTFTFFRHRLLLDLCLCSSEIAMRSELQVVPQPYSDHAALLLIIGDP